MRIIMRKLLTMLVIMSLFSGIALHIAANCYECVYLHGPAVYRCDAVDEDASTGCIMSSDGKDCWPKDPCVFSQNCSGGGGTGGGGGGGGADPSCTIYWWTCDGDPWAL
jgi:hypothetical protein